MKNKKRLFLTFLFIALFLLGSFFVDRSVFTSLKDTLVKEGEKALKKIEKKFNDTDKTNKNSKTNNKIEKTYDIKLTNDLMVFFIDVGQADAILIKSQNEYMLIDAGNNEDGSKLVDFFKSLDIEEFKYVIGTPAHEDHIGGMDNIIRSFKIDNFYMPNEVTTTQTFLTILTELGKKKIKFQTPKTGTRLKLGESDVDIVYVGDNKEDLNATSVIVKVTYKNTSFLFMADAPTSEEKLILDKDLKSTVLKVGHHGSSLSSSQAFLNKVSPEYAIISVGVNNDYHHPHDVVLNRLKKINAKVYRTDKLGTIIATSNGKEVTFKNIKTDTNGE